MNADLRLALRQLRKAPGFTLTAILTLSLAIGANAVVFSVLNALVLRPLNVPHPENLFMLERNYGSETNPSQSYPDYRDLRDRNRSFDSLVTYDIMGGVGLDAHCMGARLGTGIAEAGPVAHRALPRRRAATRQNRLEKGRFSALEGADDGYEPRPRNASFARAIQADHDVLLDLLART